MGNWYNEYDSGIGEQKKNAVSYGGNNQESVLQTLPHIYNKAINSQISDIHYWHKLVQVGDLGGNAIGKSWQLCRQGDNLYGYGLTLLNYERQMLDLFFQGITTYNSSSSLVNQTGDVQNITINMTVKTKNLKNSNNTPYSAALTLNFKNIQLGNELGSDRIDPGKDSWGYINNTTPLIERNLNN